MAGRIVDEDVAAVRQRARIDEIVGGYVALRKNGSQLTGLCPFHEEKTASFYVSPSKQVYYCHGCGEGGDVIDFVTKIENLSFVEAIERLADRVGIQLRYTDNRGPRTEPGLRSRLVAANEAAADLFAGRLALPEALPGRQFLDGRGFDRAAAEQFGIGWAPRGGRELGTILQSKGFRRDELVKAGLVRENGYDFFSGRLLWPIRDAGGTVLGFGARRILDDDRMPAKYLNTPETPLYRKSSVLYGVDLARQQIGRKQQAVVVEGYTDVMACHLSGVDTAVASCGTAFGDDHAKLLRRFMGEQADRPAEVIFTFDGDAAGQKAAMKVYREDQQFSAQTYVAVEPSGLDPCDLRLQQGEAAVRELVARRVPLYRFVMGNLVKGFDLDRAEGRVAALRAAAPLVVSVRDRSLVSEYVRDLALLVGMDPDDVNREVTRAAARRQVPPEPSVSPPSPATPDRPPLPDPADRALLVERGTAVLLVQVPGLFVEEPHWNGLQVSDFTHPAYAGLFAAVERLAPEYRPELGEWAQFLRDRCDDPVVAQLVVVLAVEPLHLNRAVDAAYVGQHTLRLRLLQLSREIDDLKSRLQRTNPESQGEQHRQMFAALLSLEARRKDLTLRLT